jgi:PAS domain S-box-containing protein
MASVSAQMSRILRSPDLRILGVMTAGVAVFGVVDGSLWRTLLAPTIAYRPAILFALTLMFGWRGFAWSGLLFLISFATFFGWRGAAFVTPLYFVSHMFGLVAARRLAKNQPWFSRERSTLAFLAGAALATAIPALFMRPALVFVGINAGPALPEALEGWLRGTAAILALSPAVLQYGSGPLRKWVGFPTGDGQPEPIHARNVLELVIEISLWTLALCASIYVKERSGLNITYITLLAPLSLALFRSMGLASLALVTNTIVATTLWSQFHWASVLSALDLRLLIAIYSTTVLVLAAVVEDRQRGSREIAMLVKAEAGLRQSEQQLVSIYNTVQDVIFHVRIERDRFRFISVNESFLRVTGLGPEAVVGKWVDEIIPEPSLTMVLGKYRQAVSENTIVSWEETSDYPTGRLTGEVTIAPVCDDLGLCTHLVGSVHDITERKQTEATLRVNQERLRNSEQQLQVLAGRLLTAQEDERRRIAYELHDNLNQGLAALAIDLGRLPGEFPRLAEGLKDRLRELQMRVVTAAEAIRHQARELHPSELEDFGLATALQASCEDFSREGLTVEFTTASLPETLDSDVASCLYQVVQESLRNVSRHAKAGRAWVTLEGLENRIVLGVRDAGVGFPVESLAAGAGLGVPVMRERVRNLKGSFSIQSRPEEGTVIVVEVPYTAENRN